MKSIYKEGTMQSSHIPTQIAVLDSERQTCENLVSMGYTHSWKQSLEERLNYIYSTIDRLESLLKRGVQII